MRPALKAKWVEALRSGKFEQAPSALFTIADDGTKAYCCLGVLCVISPAVAKRVGGGQWEWKSGGFLSDEALAYAGFDGETQNGLADMNDSGMSFRRIATYIEKNL